MPYPDNFNSREFERVWGSDDSIESAVAKIGLRAEYGEYLAVKSNPPMDFLDWVDDIHPKLLNDADRAEIAKAKAEKLATMQAKLNAWTNASVNYEVAQANQRASKSTIEGVNMSYKYQYYAKGSCIYCRDSHGVDVVNAMCLNQETAKSFCDILNAARSPSSVLEEINSEATLTKIFLLTELGTGFCNLEIKSIFTSYEEALAYIKFLRKCGCANRYDILEVKKEWFNKPEINSEYDLHLLNAKTAIGG